MKTGTELPAEERARPPYFLPAEILQENERLRAVLGRMIAAEDSTAIDITEADWIEARRAFHRMPPNNPDADMVPAPPAGSRPYIRAGDVVKHGPTGETWTLANDEENNRVSPCGWPRCWAVAADCTLSEAATDVERIEMLTRWAAKTIEETEGYDHRVSTAKHQLSANTELTGAKRPV